MYQEFRVTYFFNNDWKLPVNFAIGIHFILIVGGIYMPSLLPNKPLFPEAYTVDLIDLTSPIDNSVVSETQPEPSPPSQPITPKSKKIVSIVQPKKPQTQQPQKAISIKPLRKKIIKPIVKKQASPTKRKQQKQQEYLEALKDQQEAARKAKEAAQRAVDELKQMLKSSEEIARPSRPPQPKQKKRSVATTHIKNLYHASIFNKLYKYWSLPEYKAWSSSLKAVIIITLDRDGNIVNQFFEKRSGDRIFDQYVQKTLQDAQPLASIPTELNLVKYEIGLVFSPGNIQ